MTAGSSQPTAPTRSTVFADPFRAVGVADGISRILVVCTGNICRSPVAERLLAHRLRAAAIDGVQVESAGLRARAGRDMEPEARELLTRLGVDADGFVSRSIRDVDLSAVDVVLTATEAQRRRIVATEPAAPARVRTLLGFAGGGDLVDPFGAPPSAWTELERELLPAIDAVAAWVGANR
jgi:protein-tyrosine phosphatase